MGWTFFKLLKKTFKEFNNDNGMTLSAALAYYITLFLIPFLIVIFWISGSIVGIDFLQEQLRLIFGNGNIASLLFGLINQAYEGAKGVTISISLVLVIFFIGLLFFHLQKVLNMIFLGNKSNVKLKSKTKRARFFILNRVKSFLLIIVISFLLIPFIFLNTFISSFYLLDSGNMFWNIISTLLKYSMLLLIVGIGFYLIFRFLPYKKIDTYSNILGAGFTAFLFIVGQFFINTYFNFFTLSTEYSFLGGLLLIVLMIYYSSIIFLFGAEFTYVLWKSRN